MPLPARSPRFLPVPPPPPPAVSTASPMRVGVRRLHALHITREEYATQRRLPVFLGQNLLKRLTNSDPLAKGQRETGEANRKGSEERGAHPPPPSVRIGGGADRDFDMTQGILIRCKTDEKASAEKKAVRCRLESSRRRKERVASDSFSGCVQLQRKGKFALPFNVLNSVRGPASAEPEL